MNRMYKVVWNASLGAWVAVSEIAKSKTKSKSVKTAVAGIAVLSLSSVAIAADGNFDNISATGDIVAAGDVTAQNITALDGRVDQNETNITALDGRVGQNETNITALDGRVGQNETNITALDGRVDQNETNITALDGRVDQNETNITALDGRVGQNETNITALDGRVDQNETNITALDGRVDQNETNILTNTNNLDSITDILVNLGVDTETPGVKYFRVNSEETDAEATGENSVAIGPHAKSEGDNSLAAGNGASTTKSAQGAIALGQNAQAGTVSIDPNFVDGEGSIAIGRNSVSGGTRSTAVGDGAKATASNSAAMGNNAQATADNATALGANANASGGNSIALGNATAGSINAFAAGNGAVANSPDSISLGTGAGVNTSGTVAEDRRSQVAIGNTAGQNVTGKETIGIGFGAGSNVVGDKNMAIGTNAGTNINGEYNIAMGFEANEGAGDINHATVVGGKASAGSNSVALGYGAKANKVNSVALGNQAQAQAEGLALGANAKAGSDDVALGYNSSAGDADFNGSSYLTSKTDGAGVVSVGDASTGLTRRIVNVADGAQGNDAVNVNQLKSAQRSVSNLVGGGVELNEDGSYGKIKLQDANGDAVEFDTIFDAVGSITDGTVNILPQDAVKYTDDGRISNVTAGIEGTDAVNVQQLNKKFADEGVKYFSVNSTDGANRDNKGASGSNAIAIGPQASASGEESVALGYQARSEANTSVAIGKDVHAEGVQSTVLGNQSRVYGEKGVAIGHNAVSNGENSLVMGSGAKANEKSTGAKVDNAIVIGTSAKSTASEDGIAIGQLALARENRAMAQGFTANALADDAMAFGSDSTATGVRSTAMGTRAKSSGLNAIAQGTDAAASGDNASASGTNSNASGTRSIASGKDSKSYANDGVAMGTGAVSGIQNPTIEEQARFNANTIAIGKGASATYLDALAMGNQAQANKQDATAIGRDSVASAQDATAMGRNAKATANYAQALGVNAQASGIESIAQGRNAVALAEKALAIGSGAKATEASASAFGSGANAAAENASAFGVGATAQNRNSVAIGAGAQAQSNRSVALGNGAVAGSATGTREAEVNGLTYGDFAGINPVATVSVGTATEKRTITNVAAGDISSASTDAINGSQLYITNNVLGNVAKSTRSAIGGETTLEPNGTINTSNVGDTGKDNIHDAIKYAAQGWKVQTNDKAATNVAPGDTVNFADGKNIKITNTGKNVTVATVDDVNFKTVNVDETVTIGGDTTNRTVINKGDVSTNNLTVDGVTKLGDNFTVNTDNSVIYKGQEIANKADGLKFAGNTGDTINKKLNETLTVRGELAETEDASGANLRVDSKDGNLNLVMARDLTDLNSITINNGGPVINPDGINMSSKKITNLAPGEAGTDAVNVDQLTTKVAAATTEVEAGTNVADVTKDTGNKGQTIYTVNAKGTTASAKSDAVEVNGVEKDGNITDYEIDLSAKSKDSLNKADSALQTVVTQIDGENVKTIDKDNNTANFVTGTNMLLEDDGEGGIKVSTADDVTFTNVTSETMTVNNNNSVASGGDTNYVTEGNKSVVNGGDVYTAINTTEQQYTGDNNEVVVKRNPQQILTIKGGATTATENNIQTVANEDGSIAVKLAEKINLGTEGNVQLGNTLVDNSGVTITGGAKGPVSITNTGLNNGGNTITNLAPGVNGTDAVNVDQLTETNTTIAKGFNITADNSTLDKGKNEDNVQLGETVKYTSTDGNIITTVSDNTIDFGLGKDLTVGDNQNPGTIVVKGKDGKDGVSINGADGTIGLNGKNGANGTISVKNGVPGVNGQDGITRIVIDDIEVATMEDGLKFAGNTGDTINKKLNETLTVRGELAETEDASGANLRVDSKDGNLNLVMARDLTDLNSITINNGGPVINQDGINMGGKKITNLAPGEVGTDAVNVDQLNKVSGDVSKGLNFTGDDTTIVINRQLGQTLNITGGAIKPLSTGNIGVVANGDKLEIKLAEEIDLGDNGSVTMGDSVVNNDGLTIAGGPSVTKDGIDAGDKKITGVAKGDISKDSTDAINGSQLWDIKNNIDKDVAASKTEVEEGKNITVTEAKGTDGQTIYKVSTSDEVEFDKVDVGSVSIDKNKVDKDGNTIISGVGAGKADTDAVNVGQLKDVVAGANKGFNVTAQGKNESNVANGGSIDFNNTDGNIKVEKATDSNDISFNLSPNLDLGKEGSITTGDTKVNNSGVTTGNTSMTNNGIIINNAKLDSKDYDENKTVSVTDKGLNNGGNRITNVGPGVDGTDAVNINQLKDFGYNLGNKIDKVGDEANAGVSSAMAMAALPQAYIPGKSMVTGGMAIYNGQGAVAVGVSKLSDNGRWVLKISGSADTEGNAGGAVGAGFHF